MSLAGGRRQTLGADLAPEYFKKSVFQAACPPNVGRFADELASVLPVAEPAETSRRKRPGANNEPAPDGLVARGLAHEKNLITESLAKSFGNVSLAARLMDLSHQTLRYKIKKHGLDVQQFKAGKK